MPATRRAACILLRQVIACGSTAMRCTHNPSRNPSIVQFFSQQFLLLPEGKFPIPEN